MRLVIQKFIVNLLPMLRVVLLVCDVVVVTVTAVAFYPQYWNVIPIPPSAVLGGLLLIGLIELIAGYQFIVCCSAGLLALFIVFFPGPGGDIVWEPTLAPILFVIFYTGLPIVWFRQRRIMQIVARNSGQME